MSLRVCSVVSRKKQNWMRERFILVGMLVDAILKCLEERRHGVSWIVDIGGFAFGINYSSLRP